RVHCPFLRPFFLSPEDEQRVRNVAETMAELGERVATAALGDAELLGQFHLRDEELRLVRLGKNAGPASIASRLDVFLLPDSLEFAVYNGESAVGAGYTVGLAESFCGMPVMGQFVSGCQVYCDTLSAKLLAAVAANAVCMANHFRCKIPHVKAFFAVLTDERNDALFSFGERELIRKHVPWTRVVADVRTAHHGEPVELLALLRNERENLVLK